MKILWKERKTIAERFMASLFFQIFFKREATNLQIDIAKQKKSILDKNK